MQNYLRKNHGTFFKYEQNPKTVAEDLIQETLLKAAKSLHTFKGKSSLRTWVVRIFINDLKDYFRKKTIDPLEHLEPYAKNEDPGENLEKLIEGTRKSVANPEELLLEKEKEELQKQQKEKLDKAINELPEMERVALKLHLKDLGVKEIAEQTGLTYDTAKNYIFRAKRKLERIFKIKLPENLHLRGQAKIKT